MLRKLAVLSVRRRWWVIAAWLLLVAGATVAGQSFGGSFTNDLSLAGTDSQAAHDTLAEKFPQMSGDGMQVVVHDRDGVTRARTRRTVEAALDAVRGQPGVVSAPSPYQPGQSMVSTDGTTALVTVRFAQPAADLTEEQITAAQGAFKPGEDLGVQVEFGGAALDRESGPSGSEVFGLAAALLVLLFAFGSVFATLVPVLTAVLALGLGIGVIRILAEFVSIGTAGPVVAAMIGLGVGIDYALLVVTRHREGLATGHPARESIPIALATAGRSVLVAGTTVVIAILSLYLIGIPFVATLGLASAVTVAATLLAAVTLLPALLAVFGDHLDRFRVRRARLDHAGGRVSNWHRWTHHVQRRPWPYLLGSVVVLVMLAIPLFDLRLGTADNGSAPADSTQRRAYELVSESFGAGWTGPLLVTAAYDEPGRAALADARRLRTELLGLDGVSDVTGPMLNGSGDTALLTVVPATSPDTRATEDVVHRIRDDVLARPSAARAVHVGGPTATSIDLAERLGDRMAWFMAFVVGLSLMLLLVEFRSVFVPVKAALMNLLSVGAAYGAVVAVFQWGWLADWLGAEPGPIESFAPMMLFAVLFGLSMDYEVFLLGRVREEYLRTGRARTAVADGIAATARVITAAAAVMVVVFASFLLNDQRVVNLFGFGLAVAIAIDATVVRLVLVPALMAVAGRLAWYLPRWLDRLLPHIELEPQPIDPFEAELDALDAERPVLAHTAPNDPGSPAGAPMSCDGKGAPNPQDPYAALALLHRLVNERLECQQRCEQTRAELSDLQRRHDGLLQALATLHEAGAARHPSGFPS